MPKRAKIGDIIEIKTPRGSAYAQYTHDSRLMGQLVRVLPGMYSERPSDFVGLVSKKELYFVFYTLDHALRTGQSEIAGRQPVPDWAISPPLMRTPAFEDRTGPVWRIIDALTSLSAETLKQAPTVCELTAEQKRLPIFVSWPHEVMVGKIAQGWTPERDDEMRAIAVSQAAAKESKSPYRESLPRPMRHYLYFAEETNAQKASQRFVDQGFSVEVRLSAGGEDWLLLAVRTAPSTPEEMSRVREEMEAVAEQYKGEYDGWELEETSRPN